LDEFKTWSSIGLWFVTAFVGAALVKVIDLIANRHLEKRKRNETRAAKILDYVREYGELTQLFRFLAYYSSEVVRDESGEFKRDAEGKFVVESKALEPEPRFEEAIKSLKGSDVNTAITQKIVTIRLASSEVFDLALELDPTGELKKNLTDLYERTIHSIEVILESKNSGDTHRRFREMVSALEEADKARQQLRAKLSIFY